MLRLLDERSLFQTSVQRLDELFPPERILVVTVAEQSKQLREQAPEIPEENYLLEPAPRGTASVVGLAAVTLQQRDPESVMAILTSDHFIGNEERFRQLLRAAHDAAKDGYLVTLGIAPSFPATGYGYIQRGKILGVYNGLEVFQALHFKEKPDDKNARQMLSTGDHSWNSGMFAWRTERILAEFEHQMPELAAILRRITESLSAPDSREVIEHLWPTIKPQTVDYGIMEGANRVAVIPADGLNWSDVGSWDSLFDVLPSDEAGNIVIGGQHVGLETSDSLVYVNQEHRLIVTIGVEDLVVVDTGDVLLVCRKDQAQKVRQVVNQLRQDGQNYV
jgi:mannose-1-phosphate guanylyltransferase